MGKEYDYDGKYIIFEGEYLNDKRHGKGKEYDMNKNIVFEGEYLNGNRFNGKIKEYDAIFLVEIPAMCYSSIYYIFIEIFLVLIVKH